MSLKPAVTVDNAVEADLLCHVLADRGIVFRMEESSTNVFGLTVSCVTAFQGFARFWAAEKDHPAVAAALAEVRGEASDYVPPLRVWRIKK